MLKKALGLVITAIMLLGVFGLAACNNISLEDYKADAKASIQAHADAKGRDNYCLDRWATIEQAVTAGKQAVDDATTKPQVDAAVADTKTAINAVEREDGAVGTFYTLQEAYDEELLTEHDLMSIAHYHGSLGGVSGTFIPTPKSPESLSTTTADEICRAFFTVYVEPLVDEYDVVTIDDVAILLYYGTYNEVIAVRMKDNFGSSGVIREVIIAGVTFEYNSLNSIIVWKAN